MIEKIRNHPALPKDCEIFIAPSKFGAHVGFAHCIDTSKETEKLFYIALELSEKHAGAPGRGHGAVTMAMLDEVMGRAASRTSGNLCYTASMTTNFCSGSSIGEILVATAKVSRAGKSLVFVDAELFTEEKLIATATGTFANSGLPIPVRSFKGNQ